MPNSKLLTLNDLSIFVDKLTYTIQTAQHGEHLTASLTRLFSTTAYADLGPRQPAGEKRRSRQPRLDTAKVLSAVAGAKDGIAVGELAELLHQSVPRVRVALVRLRSDGKLQMKGNKRNARWLATKPTRAAKTQRAAKQAAKPATKDAQPETAPT